MDRENGPRANRFYGFGTSTDLTPLPQKQGDKCRMPIVDMHNVVGAAEFFIGKKIKFGDCFTEKRKPHYTLRGIIVIQERMAKKVYRNIGSGQYGLKNKHEFSFTVKIYCKF